MKKTILLLTCLTATATVFGQGRVNFDNLGNNPPNQPVTVNAQHAAGQGNTGDFVGANYTASLYYELGSVPSQAAFDAGSPILYAAANVAFFGVTGAGPTHGPTGDGAGLWAYAGGPGGSSTVTMASVPNQQITIEVRVWYNGGGNTSYAQALGNGSNVGESIPIVVTTTVSPNPAPFLNGLAPFTVGTVPEPTTIALGGLGAAALLLFRRRK